MVSTAGERPRRLVSAVRARLVRGDDRKRPRDPRAVTGIPAAAGAAMALETPGTTSTVTPPRGTPRALRSPARTRTGRLP